MAFDAHKNFAYSTVAVAPSPAISGTSLTVATGEGAKFPAVPFNATVWPVSAIPLTTNAEIVRVTNIAGDVLTITRAQESTSARTVLIGDQIAATITVKTLTDVEAAVGGANIKISAGTTSTSRSDWTLSNSNGLAFGLQTNGIITGSYTVPTVTAGSDTAGMSNLGNTSGTTGVVSGDAIRVLFAGGNNITLSQSINGVSATITISGANAGGAQTGISGVVVSNTTYTSGTISFSNAGNITISSSVNGATQYVVLSGNAAQTVESNTFGMSNLGNTSGTTGVVSGGQVRMLLAGGTNITLSQSINGVSATVTVVGATYSTVGTATTVASVASANSVGTATRWAAEDHRHAGVGGIGISTAGNTTGTTGSVLGTYWLQGGNNLTLSQITSNNGSHTLVLLDPPALSQFDPDRNAPITNSTFGQSTLYFRPVDIDHPLSASRINFFLSLTHTFSGAPANSTAWLAMGYGLYTRGTGASSDRISLLTSYSLSYVSASASSSTRLSVTNYVGLSNATSHSTSQYGVLNATVSDYLGSSIAGFRVLALPMNLTLSPGRYWLGASLQSNSGGASLVLAHNILQYQYSNYLAFRPIGVVSAASNANMYGASDGWGIYSAQSAAWPNSIPLTSDSIRLSNIVTAPYFNISGIGTSPNIL
jgi:hypothetical protein